LPAGIPGLLIGAFLMICGYLLSKMHRYKEKDSTGAVGYLADHVFDFLVVAIVTALGRRVAATALRLREMTIIPSLVAAHAHM
jgi:hypothetical protein